MVDGDFYSNVNISEVSEIELPIFDLIHLIINADADNSMLFYVMRLNYDLFDIKFDIRL